LSGTRMERKRSKPSLWEDTYVVLGKDGMKTDDRSKFEWPRCNLIPNGTWRTWFENGQLEEEKFFEQGVGFRVHKRWYEDGTPSYIRRFDKSGQNHGEWLDWYSNGQLHEQGTFKNGERVGIWREWSKEGQLLQKYSLNPPGILQGDWEEWYDNGQRKRITAYRNDEQYGRHIEWYQNGQKKEEGQYRSNKKIGVWIAWYASGRRLIEEQLNESGKPSAIQRWWPNGNLRWQFWGEKGEVQEWWENGNRRHKYQLINGEVDLKTVINFDEKGNVVPSGQLSISCYEQQKVAKDCPWPITFKRTLPEHNSCQPGERCAVNIRTIPLDHGFKSIEKKVLSIFNERNLSLAYLGQSQRVWLAMTTAQPLKEDEMNYYQVRITRPNPQGCPEKLCDVTMSAYRVHVPILNEVVNWSNPSYEDDEVTTMIVGILNTELARHPMKSGRISNPFRRLFR